MIEIVLSSSSPRRREILKRLGFSFHVFHPSVEEVISGENLERELLELAERKAAQARRYFPQALIVGCDTVVMVKGEIMGKPLDEADAEQMLMRLSGRWHEVLSSLVLLLPGGERLEGVEVTRVKFRNLSPSFIKAYIESGEPLDKAGAYGIQGRGACLVERIEGCFFNVVGFPLALFVNLLEKANLQDLLFSALRQKSL